MVRVGARILPRLLRACVLALTQRELEIDLPEAVVAATDELGHSGADYLDGAVVTGAARLEACIEEGLADEIFGVPIFVFDGEVFWGHDRIGLLEERLGECGLGRA